MIMFIYTNWSVIELVSRANMRNELYFLLLSNYAELPTSSDLSEYI